jgi:CubicO group peptidase (beta-lactamase class C family)
MTATTSRRQVLLAATAAVVAGSNPSSSQGKTAMGFSKPGLEALDRSLRDHVAKGSAPGAVGLVSRGGETHAFVAGRTAIDGPEMRRDAIFRIASMTKPFTAAAAMMLIEDGKLKLDEPVERLAPELANRRVLRTLASPLDDTVPAQRPITLEDVLTFRLGWGVLFDPELPIVKATADVPGFGMPNPDSPYTPDSFMRKQGELPLMAQPGERWLYTVGANVLGVLVARAAGQPLDEVFRTRLFEPIGLADTAFFAPPGKVSRLVTGYLAQDGKLDVYDPPAGMFSRKPAFPAGDSGLVSTADDFLKFSHFLATGVAPGGRRLLSEASLKAMRVNRLSPAQMEGGVEILGPGRGWGYGMGVAVAATPDGLQPGAYGWDGGFGTSWFTDPAKGLTAILLTQRFFDSPTLPPIHQDFRRGAYAALA